MEARLLVLNFYLLKCKKKLKHKHNPSTPTKHREIWYGTPGAYSDPNFRAAENETLESFRTPRSATPRSATPRSATPRSARALFKGGKRKKTRRKRGGKPCPKCNAKGLYGKTCPKCGKAPRPISQGRSAAILQMLVDEAMPPPPP